MIASREPPGRRGSVALIAGAVVGITTTAWFATVISRPASINAASQQCLTMHIDYFRKRSGYSRNEPLRPYYVYQRSDGSSCGPSLYQSPFVGGDELRSVATRIDRLRPRSGDIPFAAVAGDDRAVLRFPVTTAGFTVRTTTASFTAHSALATISRGARCFASPQSLTLVFNRALRLGSVPPLQIHNDSTRRVRWVYTLVDATTKKPIADEPSDSTVPDSTGSTIHFPSVIATWTIEPWHSYVFSLRNAEAPELPCRLSEFGLRRIMRHV